MGIGAQKAGTSWLHAQLSRHPRIGFPGGKEMHFWDRMKAAEEIPKYLATFRHPERLEGEITPAYAILPEVRIAQLREVAPQLRLLYLLRNPVERAWSSALMALGRAEMRRDEASDQWFIDHFHSRGSLARGDYARCLENWLAHFPREQLLVLRYEHIETQPEALLDSVCVHIGVETPNEAMRTGLKERVFAGSGESLPPHLRAHLVTLYHDRVRALEAMLGDSLDEWLAVPE